MSQCSLTLITSLPGTKAMDPTASCMWKCLLFSDPLALALPLRLFVYVLSSVRTSQFVSWGESIGVPHSVQLACTGNRRYDLLYILCHSIGTFFLFFLFHLNCFRLPSVVLVSEQTTTFLPVSLKHILFPLFCSKCYSSLASVARIALSLFFFSLIFSLIFHLSQCE